MYKEINDSELLYMINESDDYLEIMLDKYKSVMTSICKKYYQLAKKIGYELDDLMQIASISLIKAIKHYQNNQNTLFYTYLVKCIENNIKTSLQKEFTNHQKTLNNSISIDETIPGTSLTLLDVIENHQALNPENSLIIDEIKNSYIKLINSLPFEMAVVYEMKKNGFNNESISKLMNLDNKTINNFFRYAKTKMRLNY